MLKAYAIGFFGAVLALGLAAAIWLATQPEQQPRLVWGPAPRTQVKGAARTEDDGRTTRQVVEDWATDLPLTPLVAILAGGATLILVRRRSQPSSETASMEQPEVAPPAHVPRSGQVVIRTARAYVKRVPTFLRERNIGASDVAFGLLGFATLGFFMLFVALLASA